jgi:hypothetical protein
MRLAILALLICPGATAICQSTANIPAKPDASFASLFSNPASRVSSLQSAIPNLALLNTEGQLNLPKNWHWNAALTGTQMMYPPQQAIPLQGPIAKLEPIPTEWPNLKVEEIPTDWPNLKVVRVSPPDHPPAPVKAPSK